MLVLHIYLAGGGVALALTFARAFRTRMNPFVEAEESGAQRYLIPALALTAIFLFWPVMLWMLIYDKLRPERRSSSLLDLDEPADFKVSPDQLRTRVSVATVEAHETVSDPLGAAPRQPFGFLNARWQEFLAAGGAEDELWSFEATWSGATRTGYARVRAGEVISFFHSGWRLEDKGDT